MIDPMIWANTPGMGRAPLLPSPTTADPAVADPRADLARRLIPEDRRVMASDRPVGAVVRPPSAMTLGQMVSEERSLKGAQGYAPRVASTLASGGLPLIGSLAAAAGNRGVDQRLAQFGSEIPARMAPLLATGQRLPPEMDRGDQRGATVARVPPTQQLAFADAYEAGRQAAVRDTGGHQRDRSSRASAGLTGGFDPETGFGGA